MAALSVNSRAITTKTICGDGRDSLLKKGLIYSGERGRIAFTVPHFGRYLRAQG